MAYHVDGFVREITVYPDLVTVFALPEMIATFQEVLQSKTTSPVCLVYDTTFNLGDFYLSPLVFKHVLFEETPWIPLAFLIHDRKHQKYHNRLFEFIAEKVPILKSTSIPFITDREPALTNAVKMFFPDMAVFHCWNHIRRDFKEELRKQGADSTEMSVYLSEWKQMSQCSSESHFIETYEELTCKWTQSVKTYFDKSIKPDILKYSGRWLIEEFRNLYDPYSGVTNNPAEALNSVLKRMTGWQELPVDVMMLSLYHLQNFYHAEIQRGRAGIGNYQLKQKYRQAMIDREELVVPKKLVEPEEIVTYVKSVIGDLASSRSETDKQVRNVSHNASSDDEANARDEDQSDLETSPKEIVGTPGIQQSDLPDAESSPDADQRTPSPRPAYDRQITQKAMAKYVVDNDGVTQVPECDAFVVKGNNNKKYCVTLDPDTCQCPSSTTCYHIMAVKMFLGQDISDDHREVSLRSLSKRSLKRSDKKSGRKRPRANDIDQINPAPDSKAASMDNELSDTTSQATDIESDIKPLKTPKSKKKLRFNNNVTKSPLDAKLPVKKRKIAFAQGPFGKMGGESDIGTQTED